MSAAMFVVRYTDEKGFDWYLRIHPKQRWTTVLSRAVRHRTRKEAETESLLLVAQHPELMGEVDVVEVAE